MSTSVVDPSSPKEEPAEKYVVDELDDLFGDDSEEENQINDSEENDEQSDASGSGKKLRRVIDEEEDEEQAMYNRKFLGEDYEGQSEEEFEKKYKEVDVEIVNHVVPYKTANAADDKTIYYAKVPQFLTIDPIPFDPLTFQKKVEERMAKYSSKEDQLGDRLIEENTIRWRYSRDKDQRVFKESNAQIIQWSDGSFSLKIGDEYTDILVNNTENTYLTVSHEDQELIQCVEGGEITKSLMFVPTSTNSKVHQALSKAVARRDEREQHGPSTYIVRMDPELEKRELEKKHDQILRERRKKQLKQKLEQENAGESPEPQFNLQKSLPRRRNLDEYEYDDGFVAEDDEEELEEEEDEEFSDERNASGSDSEDSDSEQESKNAEKLKKVKQAGTEEYQTEDSHTKKRRIAVLDDEDDE